MDPNDRLWPEKSLGLTLSVDLRAFWQGNADIYMTLTDSRVGHPGDCCSGWFIMYMMD